MNKNIPTKDRNYHLPSGATVFWTGDIIGEDEDRHYQFFERRAPTPDWFTPYYLSVERFRVNGDVVSSPRSFEDVTIHRPDIPDQELHRLMRAQFKRLGLVKNVGDEE